MLLTSLLKPGDTFVLLDAGELNRHTTNTLAGISGNISAFIFLTCVHSEIQGAEQSMQTPTPSAQLRPYV